MFARAAELDPRSGSFWSLINTLAFLGRRDDAMAAVARARTAQPDNAEGAVRGGQLAFDFDCDLRTWEAVLKAVPPSMSDAAPVLSGRWFFALTTGDYAQAIGIIEQLAAASPAGEYEDQLGWTYSLAGRKSESAEHYRKYVQEGTRQLQRPAAG